MPVNMKFTRNNKINQEQIKILVTTQNRFPQQIIENQILNTLKYLT